MSRKPYPNYKPSGVPWLGEIPSHWGFRRIKHNTYVKGRIGWQGLNSSEFCDSGAYLVTGTDFINGTINWSSCYHVATERYLEDPYIQLKKGDLLITKDGTIGKLAVVKSLPDIATLNSGIFVARPLREEYLSTYLFWILSSDVFNTFIDLTKTGTTISHLYQNVFVEFTFPIPTINEQQIITDYLDAETSKIDGLVEKKKRQIELLKEKQSAVISRAVTRGLDPSAPLKPSGIPWLGDIPSHWEAVTLKRITNFGYGDSLSSENRSDGDVNVYGSNGVVGKHNTKNTKSPCVIVGRKGSFGKVVYSDMPCFAIDTTYFIDSTQTKNNLRWLFYLLQWLKLDSFSKDSAVPGLSREDAYENTSLLLPLEEQRQIANYLDTQTSKIDRLIAKIESSIELLKEYRSSLISACVTGRIDVRDGEAAQ